MTVSLEEELRAGIVVLVVLICLKVFQTCLLLGLNVCILQECSFITRLFRFSEIVVLLFDGINKSFGHPWESFFCQGALHEE